MFGLPLSFLPEKPLQGYYLDKLKRSQNILSYKQEKN